MVKSSRYAIHYSIIALILSIPLIITFSTYYKSIVTPDEFPEQIIEVVADGVITNKYISDSKSYIVVNKNSIYVSNDTYNNHNVGNRIVLTKVVGQSFKDVIFIFITIITSIVLFVISIFGIIFLFECYFKWLKGDK